MTLALYHYVHCPFCVRVRMALGHLNLPYESHVLAYDDEETPVRLTGIKMLPALATENKVINESLDIIALIDKNNHLKVREVTESSDYPQLESFLSRLGNPVHSLAMPYWIWTPEFTSSSREYFQKKKEKKRGPFKDLVKNQNQFIEELKPLLDELKVNLKPFYRSETFGLKDILIASHIWGLYVVPEFQFTPEIHSYLQTIKLKCSFNYHQDFWR